jgi:dihydropteroate synthase
MGILNVTPDSFYDGGRYSTPGDALAHAERLVSEGADIIDVGGESTRPSSVPVKEEEEVERILPVIRLLSKHLDTPISIDTYKAGVARIALEEGAEIVNDISGLGFDRRMAEVVAKFEAGLVVMHIQGKPQTMQVNPEYKDLVADVTGELRRSMDRAERAGLRGDNIAIDPGLGFGKSLKDNYTLIQSIPQFKKLGRPVLVGPSRKSFLWKVMKCTPTEGLEGTISAAIFSYLYGADILRVHDVGEVSKALIIAEEFIGGGSAR